MDFSDHVPGNTTDLDRLHPIDLEQEMKKSFISYAMAVIITRALPDVRDGLKPVHRRILFAMHELGVTPDKPYRKCARIVGDVLGKYHPHGDSSVYGALVRLAQDFATRYPLVDGQGNFGSIDGDGAAAMRYTEARMSKINLELLADIDKETVDFYPNFDETLMQPTVLPCRFPNLLVNGSNGIAVGMATNIPPHNLGEVIDGVVMMIDNPEVTSQELMQVIKGPDFPGGGIILGKKGIFDTYTTGRGKILVRAKTDIEPMNAGRQRIVISELPYMVNKAQLVEKIAGLVHEKRIEGISDIRDESDREGMRIVSELKKDVSAIVVLNYLYKHTQLQDTFGAIMLALVDGEPKILTLREIIYYYLEHQKDVIVRRTKYELDKAEARAHILEGLLIALDNIDEIVQIIRNSANTAVAKAELMARFSLSDRQAQAILDMRLARLTGLERERLQEEYQELEKTIAYLKAVLADEKMVLSIIRSEILEIKTKYADPRRTTFSAMEGEIDPEDLIQEENIVITFTNFGYIKRIASDTYRSQKRGGKGITGLTAKEEDFASQMLSCSTHDEILFFTNRGRVYKLKGYEIPEAGRTAKGTAIVNLLQLDGGEKVTTMIPLPRDHTGYRIVMVTRRGIAKRCELTDFDNLRKSGLIAINLDDEDEMVGVELTSGEDQLMIATRAGMVIRFDENLIRILSRQARGVRAIRLKGVGTKAEEAAEEPEEEIIEEATEDVSEDSFTESVDEIVALEKVRKNATVLTITEKGFGKRSELDAYRVQGRGGKGIRIMKITDKTGPLVSMMVLPDFLDLMAITNEGIIIRTPVSSISVVGRMSQGVRVMRLDEGSKIVSVTAAEPEETSEELPEETGTQDEEMVDEAPVPDEENDSESDI